jgi:hypothetical protein
MVSFTMAATKGYKRKATTGVHEPQMLVRDNVGAVISYYPGTFPGEDGVLAA